MAPQSSIMQGKWSGIQIAQVGGVQIRAHLSLILLIFYLITVARIQLPLMIESSRLPPDQIHGNPLLWGVLFSLGLIACLLLHELGHVAMARKLGLEVRSITLMLLGGVSEMDRLPPEPSSELKISICGPLVSLGLALLGSVLYRFSSNAPLALYGYWMSQANFVLALFNLLPAFPLDGGRVYRAWLSQRFGLEKATEKSVRLAKAFAWILGVFGLLQFHLILVLIAAYIHSAARLEWIDVQIKRLLSGIQIGKVLRRVPFVRETDSVQQVATLMAHERVRVLPVLGGNHQVFLISMDQLLRLPKELWLTMKVQEVMSHPPKVVREEELVSDEAIDVLAAGVLPVVHDDELVGVIQSEDLLEFMEFQKIQDQDQLRQKTAE